jgi:hypothetical protein
MTSTGTGETIAGRLPLYLAGFIADAIMSGLSPYVAQIIVGARGAINLSIRYGAIF